MNQDYSFRFSERFNRAAHGILPSFSTGNNSHSVSESVLPHDSCAALHIISGYDDIETFFHTGKDSDGTNKNRFSTQRKILFRDPGAYTRSGAS